MEYVLEICAQDYASCLAAKRASAGRIELCSSLETGGISPSPALVEAALALNGPEVYVLVRPRSGYFSYGPAEFEIILKDIAHYRTLGVHGIVCGSLNKQGRIDEVQLSELLDASANLGFTFHRAFDLIDDQFKALEVLMKHGVKRVLTSGGERSALDGLYRITQLVKQAGSAMSIMPGTGIHSGVLKEIMECGAREFHLSAQRVYEYEVEYTGKELFSTTFRSSNEAEINACLTILEQAQKH